MGVMQDNPCHLYTTVLSDYSSGVILTHAQVARENNDFGARHEAAHAHLHDVRGRWRRLDH